MRPELSVPDMSCLLQRAQAMHGGDSLRPHTGIPQIAVDFVCLSLTLVFGQACCRKILDHSPLRPSLQRRPTLGTTYCAGLRVSEVAALNADDIDSKRMLVR